MNGTPRVVSGRPDPLGATWDGAGVNFALFSEHADRVQLCLFDDTGRHEIAALDLPGHTHDIWHGYLPDARPGLLYGYRVSGPYEPERGHRFNAHKLLLDPYARSIVGTLRWSDAQFGYRIGAHSEDLSFDRRNSAPGMPRCRVIDSAFSWGGDAPPRTPWADTVIYELHVRGFTIQHPRVPPPLRGTFAGLASDASVDHLKRLGITAIELMPIHAFVDDRQLVARNLRNYWGYNTIGYFAPHAPYCASGHIGEFKTFVKRMHHAGIEVLLDVVYNHTAEGDHLGPTLCFRGIDNASYYRLDPQAPRFYRDVTGCGNSLNVTHRQVLKLIMDSLRYWVEDMHVDGFRFDLATALAREPDGFDPGAAFFDIIHQDPVLSKVKLIAEPWDLGEDGYQVGHFPSGWSEWNASFRDTVRRYWRNEPGTLGDLASRLSGSSDLYGAGGRGPAASVNFVTAHDGFTLADLVTYNEKHNEANLEDNRDGMNDNFSWNCGAEGVSTDPGVAELRDRQKRNLLMTLLLSQGTPMLLAGDEINRTQNGNNNAYCQDNPISWIDWTLRPESEHLLRFVATLIRVRKTHPAFRRRDFFKGREGPQVDVLWFGVEGRELDAPAWAQPDRRALAAFMPGGGPGDSDFLMLLNSDSKEVKFELVAPWHDRWECVLSSAAEPGTGELLALPGRSMKLLQR
ncbi:MAG: glycogen debranching protein GlgX [Acidiferrobacteraceae bacterium]